MSVVHVWIVFIEYMLTDSLNIQIKQIKALSFLQVSLFAFQIAGGFSWADPLSLWAVQGGAAQNPWDCLKVWTDPVWNVNPESG